jgi:hypothetical protein
MVRDQGAARRCVAEHISGIAWHSLALATSERHRGLINLQKRGLKIKKDCHPERSEGSQSFEARDPSVAALPQDDNR